MTKIEELKAAFEAAKHYKSWGRLNAVAYLNKRGVPRHLLTVALQLEAMR